MLDYVFGTARKLDAIIAGGRRAPGPDYREPGLYVLFSTAPCRRFPTPPPSALVSNLGLTAHSYCSAGGKRLAQGLTPEQRWLDRETFGKQPLKKELSGLA